MPIDDQYDWFGYSQKKFLHNIDTFYYSVKFRNDFRLKTSDAHVLKMRRFFKLQYDYLNNNEDQPELYLPDLGKNLYLKPVTFSRFYTTCLTYPEYFDIFFAPVVPKAADGGVSVTCECVVQIRSYMLWIMGVRDAFENSYEYVKNIAKYFGLQIDFVQENRIDYCWHSNYLKDPETFFSPENFYKMRVDRFKMRLTSQTRSALRTMRSIMWHWVSGRIRSSSAFTRRPGKSSSRITSHGSCRSG